MTWSSAACWSQPDLIPGTTLVNTVGLVDAPHALGGFITQVGTDRWPTNPTDACKVGRQQLRVRYADGSGEPPNLFNDHNDEATIASSLCTSLHYACPAECFLPSPSCTPAPPPPTVCTLQRP